jgi:hypothetical protein
VTAEATQTFNALATAFASYNATAAAAALTTVNAATTVGDGASFSTAADAVTKTGDNVVLKLSFTSAAKFQAAQTAFNNNKDKQCSMATPLNLCPGLNCDKTSVKYCMNYYSGALTSGRRLLDSEQAEVRRLQTAAAKITFSRITSQSAVVANAQQATGTAQSPGGSGGGGTNDRKTGANAVGLGVATALALAVFQ